MNAFGKTLLLIWVLSWNSSSWAQIEKLEPPHWWTGFKHQSLQLLIYGDGMASCTPTLEYPGVELTGFHKGDSPNYLFLDLKISAEAKAGEVSIYLRPEKDKRIKLKYKLLDREEGVKGFDSSDVIYLITPDRFANGNLSNDSVKGLLEQGVNRDDDYARHGGDIQGIRDHLDYIQEMGFTALWSSPLLENDMAEQSYHGYAITDYYAVDPRFGSLEEYKKLAHECQKRGIKLIMDQVANHCGRNHWWMRDLPFSDWLNFQDSLESGEALPNSNHRRTTHQDPYASEADGEAMTKGWFVDAMPDLNQKNEFLANYLIQNSLWWIESLKLGGIRQDTYPYPDKAFMSQWAGRIMQEHPDFSIVGEEWSYNPLMVGYWLQGANNRDGYESHLSSSMDFPLQKALKEALIEEESWDKGLTKLYEGLANDFHYSDPQSLMFFADNHDMDRIATQLNEDPKLIRMAMTFLLVSPRIPQVYYGTEILMQNSAEPGDHGLIRTDFPGGWKGDEVNAFRGYGLNSAQKEMQDYMKTLLNFRKDSKLIHSGKTRHFAPQNGVYTFFRYNKDEVLMLILNKNEQEWPLEMSRFKEMKLSGMNYQNIITGKQGVFTRRLLLPSRSTTLLLFKK